jgi:hypothetical protein
VHYASCVATHEAAYGYEALLRNTKMKNVRFASWRQHRRFTEAARLLLHIRVANAHCHHKLTERSLDLAIHIIDLVSKIKRFLIEKC